MIDDVPEELERRWRQNLLGRDNAEQFEKRRPGNRPFRPKPVIVTYEYYILRGNHIDPTFWRINRVENGRSEHYDTFHSEGDCMAAVAALRRDGFTVKELIFGDHARKQTTTRRSGRQIILDRLKDFKVGGSR